MHQHRIFVQLGEGVFGDLRGHERMAVAVAADPAGEAQFWVSAVETEIVDIPTRVFPGEFEGAVEAQHDFRKCFGEVGQGVAEFFLNIGALHEDFAGIPEGLKFGAEGIGNTAAVVGVLAGRFVVAEFFVDGLVTLTDRGALRFGRVGGENGLDADFFEGGDDGVLAQARLHEAGDDRGPESLDGSGTMGGAPGASEFPGNPFFDDVEKLEADGKELGPFAFVSGRDGIGKGFPLLPGDEGAQSLIERKCACEHGGGVGETGVEFAKSFFEIAVVLDGVGHSRGRMA